MTAEATYALYRGDDFVDLGTARELGERHGIKPKNIQFMASPSHKRRGNYAKRLAAYRIEDGK